MQKNAETIKFKKENPHATEQEILQFRIKSKIKEVNGCWEWQGNINVNGYGHIEVKGKGMNAHRASWIAYNGDIESRTVVCHNCPNGDNRRCVNPDHLFIGSHKDNTRDMVNKGRDNWYTCRKFPVGTMERAGELRIQGKMYREIMVELNLTMDQVKSLLQNYKRNQKKLS